jgi:hypothetical protein
MRRRSRFVRVLVAVVAVGLSVASIAVIVFLVTASDPQQRRPDQICVEGVGCADTPKAASRRKELSPAVLERLSHYPKQSGSPQTPTSGEK